MNLTDVFNDLQSGTIIWIVLLLAATDVGLGIMRSLKQHHFKSSINKSGIINKAAIVISVVFFYVLDLLLGINSVGFSELFGGSLCLAELVSVLTNLRELNVPFPKAITEFLDKFTAENKEEKQNDKV